MRRPLDWLVVSISLMVLFGSRMSTDSDPSFVAPVPDFVFSMENVGQNESPFAYIREDGSEVFLPASGSRRVVTARPTNAATVTADWTWSLPMVMPIAQ